MTNQEGIYVFDTKIGPVGIAWTEKGIDRVQLPADSPEATTALLAKDTKGRAVVSSPPSHIRQAASRIKKHFAGNPDPLTDIKIDLSKVSDFSKKVYQALRKVRPGKTVTYAELAKKAGSPKAARAAGRAMGSNPIPVIIPCHRVLASDRKLGGFSAPRGVATKVCMLHAEGVSLDPNHEKGMKHLKAADKKLKPVIDKIGPYLAPLGSLADPYQSLVQAIVYQQLSTKAASTIAGRLRALGSNGNYPDPEKILDLSNDELRAVGISAQKAGYLKDLAYRVRTGDVNLSKLGRMTDEQVIDQLTKVKGIGLWSAQMFLIFHLGRLDVLPLDDLGFQNGVKRVYKQKDKPSADQIEKLAEKWQPYRSMAAWYLWQYLDTVKD